MKPTNSDNAAAKNRQRLTAILVTTLALSLLLPSAEAAVADNRVLIVYDKGVAQGAGDAKAAEEAFKAGGIPAGRIKVAGLTGADFKPGNLKALMEDWFEDGGASNGNMDTKIFWYIGHGNQAKDAMGNLVDEAPGDEGGGTAEKNDERLSSNPDDSSNMDEDYSNIYAGLDGDKVIIYEMCHAEGMWDGTSDPRPLNTFFMGSYRSTQSGTALQFITFMKKALDGTADGSAGGGTDGIVTTKEIQAYLLANIGGTETPAFDKTAASAENIEVVTVPPAPAPDAPAPKRERQCVGPLGGHVVPENAGDVQSPGIEAAIALAMVAVIAGSQRRR